MLNHHLNQLTLSLSELFVDQLFADALTKGNIE